MRSPQYLVAICSALLAALITLVSGTAVGDDQPPLVDYQRDIQPLLQSRCYSCHGPDMQEAGLRLDIKQRALLGGDGGKVIQPGNSGESRLIQLVAGLDEDTGPMPPEGEGTPLTDQEITLLKAWIEQGADWPNVKGQAAGSTHWAFQPIQQPALPVVRGSDWIRNPVDHFILAALEARQIAPSPQADRATLIRRVYLDILGVLPSPAEVDAFVHDTRPDAYERLVDRALASPHFGERWGRHWLDLARYADSDGYEKDRARPFAWRYRDWVVDAINADMPYDRFTIEQIAGDMLSGAGTSQQIAVGFHRNTLHNTEGGTDPEEDRVKKTVDRTNTVGTIWLGMTVGCAQCHSHKYDPLTHREYYALYALFNEIDEVDPAAALEQEQRAFQVARARHQAAREPLVEQLAAYDATRLAAARESWMAEAAENPLVWHPIEVTAASSLHGAELAGQDDGSLLAKGTNQVSDEYTIEGVLARPGISALRLEVLPDASLTKKGPGRADNGNFVLTDVQLSIADGNSPDAAWQTVGFAGAESDFAQKNCPPTAAINGDSKDFWAVSPEFGKRHVIVLHLAEAVTRTGQLRVRIKLNQHYHGKPHNLGRFRLTASDASGPWHLEGLPSDIAEILNTPARQRSEADAQRLAEYHRQIDPQRNQLQAAIAAHDAKAPTLNASKVQSVLQRKESRPAHIHLRGDFLSPGDAVQPGTPEVLPPMEAEGAANRLEFAHWLVSPQHPLTARVAVNRIWSRIFGRGIVSSIDDFGKQGEPPSHPELLDWLAGQFRDQGWSRKQMLRLILASATYRQSSATRPELRDSDPENILLARQNRQRVEAEVIRDLSLSASGLFEPRLGGPSVRPPQPAEYSALTYANSAKWQESTGGDRYRRGLYTFFQRTSPYPMLMTFDSPDSNVCAASRSTSNTPLQALTVWNDPAFFEAAQALGRRVVRESVETADPEQTVRQRIDYAFRVCLSRPPTKAEQQIVLDLYHAQRATAAQHPGAAAEIIGNAARPANVTDVELAAWILVGRALLNLDEFITRE